MDPVINFVCHILLTIIEFVVQNISEKINSSHHCLHESLMVLTKKHDLFSSEILAAN